MFRWIFSFVFSFFISSSYLAGAKNISESLEDNALGNLEYRHIYFNKASREDFYLLNTSIEEDHLTISPVFRESFISKDGFWLDFESDQDKALFLNMKNQESFTLSENSISGKKSLSFHSLENSPPTFQYPYALEYGMEISFYTLSKSTHSGNILHISSLNEQGHMVNVDFGYHRGHFSASFQNIFYPRVKDSYQDTQKEISISFLSDMQIVPNVWIHHRITIDTNKKSIVYYINGEIDKEVPLIDIKNPIRNQNLEMHIPKNSTFTLGKGFLGYMDGFYMQQKNSNTQGIEMMTQVSGYTQNLFQQEDALAITKVIELDAPVLFHHLEVKEQNDPQSDYRIYYRASETIFSPDTPESILPYELYEKDYQNQSPIQKKKIQFVQFKIVLLSNAAFSASPWIEHIRFAYQKLKKPSPPKNVVLFPQQRGFLISLDIPTKKNVDAYVIEIKKDSSILSLESDQFSFTIPIGLFHKDLVQNRMSYLLSPLEPNTLYRVQVKALSSIGLESTPSAEVEIRAS